MICVLSESEWRDAWSALPDDRREPYWHPAFLAAASAWEGAQPECLLFERAGRRLLYSYLRHPVVDYDSAPRRPLFDIQTAYGYGGPLFVGNWSFEEKVDALEHVRAEFRSSNVVAEFVRCHTEWCDPSLLEAAGFKPIRVRTNVECRLDIEGGDFTASWAPMAKRNLRIAGRSGLRYRLGTTKVDLAAFANLYHHTFQRIGMAEFYRFNVDYFCALSTLPPENVAIILVECPCEGGVVVIACSLVLFGGKLAYYHLGGSDLSFRERRPNDFLYWAMGSEAQKRGCQRIVWGGGTSDNYADSLFRFKAGFGDIQKPAFVAGRLVDADAYDKLCTAWARNNPHKESKLFLRYRA